MLEPATAYLLNSPKPVFRCAENEHDLLGYAFSDDPLTLLAKVTPVNVEWVRDAIQYRAQIVKGTDPFCLIADNGIGRGKKRFEVDLVRVGFFFNGLPTEHRGESVRRAKGPDDIHIGYIRFGDVAGQIRAAMDRGLRLLGRRTRRLRGGPPITVDEPHDSQTVQL